MEIHGLRRRLYVAFVCKASVSRMPSYDSLTLLVPGMCREKLDVSNQQEILSIYLTAVLSLPKLEAEIARSSPADPGPATGTGPVRLPYPSFTRYRELWRWVERLLWRAIVIASRICPLNTQEESILWLLLSHYHSCSAHWPPTFRAGHRSAVATLHLRALVLHSRSSSSSLLASSISLKSNDGKEAGSVPWVTQARRVIREYRDILSATTHFPKANERNIQAEELVDLTIAVWEASGASSLHTGWVMDVRPCHFFYYGHTKLLPDTMVGNATHV
jgi:hypothetical protein